jgi:hypothetical protein
MALGAINFSSGDALMSLTSCCWRYSYGNGSHARTTAPGWSAGRLDPKSFVVWVEELLRRCYTLKEQLHQTLNLGAHHTNA